MIRMSPAVNDTDLPLGSAPSSLTRISDEADPRLIIGQKVLGLDHAVGRDKVIARERNTVERMILWNIRIEDSELANNNAALVG